MAKYASSRQRIVRKLAARVGIPYKELNYIWNELMDLIADELKEGNEVPLAGLGKFYFKEHKEPRVSNLTKQVIPPHRQLKFQFNSDLSRYIRVMTREH